ncbi:oligopeptide/dipeptide ABC transporter ATP-binding protein [Streptomyces sp. NRRL F-2799]|uniref:oligopeptide/dipeptide ABC transporter ATP-binding protein n=1 Tax=Streptomyces sp. NRRL F-2799 TaxID=1463844 RepID=UPI0004C849CA|nr:oligopeptide/dipeptide ABC transporter ATP-binding protein [Streptomyces sp. NRRL F-2799]
MTKDLLLPAPRDENADAGGEPLLEVSGLTKHFPVKGGFPIRRTIGAVQAVDGIDLSVRVGESFGLVGESGCGKSTTGRLITRLMEPTAGTISYRGKDISRASRRELAPIRSEIQMIFQDPYSSLNPRQTVGKIIAGPMEINGIEPPGGREKRVRAQRVAVMYLGKIIEVGDRDSIYTRPRHPYTHALLSAVPEVSVAGEEAPARERIRLAGDVPSPIDPPSGCRFRTRCWKAQDKCASEEPPLVQLSGNRAGHLTACHFPEEPTTEAREEDIILDPALVALEEDTSKD